MNREEIRATAQAIEEIIRKEGEYTNSAIDEKAPEFLQVAKSSQNREYTVDFIASALEKGDNRSVEIYHYLEGVERDVRDARYEDKSTELADYAAVIDDTIREVEAIGKQNIERDKLSHDDR